MLPTSHTKVLQDQLFDILRAERPNTARRSHGKSTLDDYGPDIFSQIMMPLLRTRHSLGLISFVDEGDHETGFAAAWNRALKGISEPFDYRDLLGPFFEKALEDAPDTAPGSAAVKTLLFRHLPDFLTGDGQDVFTGEALFSWTANMKLGLRFEKFQPVLCAEDGSPLPPCPPWPMCDDGMISIEPVDYLMVCSFKADGCPLEQFTKAEIAQAEVILEKAMDAARLFTPDRFESLPHQLSMSLDARDRLGFHVVLSGHCDFSLEHRPEGFILYRGAVASLDQMTESKGFLCCGPKSAFHSLLVQGGFTETRAEAYLGNLVESACALAARAPAGSLSRMRIDPDIFTFKDLTPEDDLFFEDPSEALPVFAAGTFPMPDMPSCREIKAHRLDSEEDLTP